MAAISDAAWIFLGISLVFYAVLALKPVLKLSVCSICAAVSLSWVTLLALRAFDWYSNDVLLALLIGMSVVGGYYLWERHAKSDQLIFRLPVMLSLAYFAWSAVTLQLDPALFALIATVWLLHGLLYVYRNSPSIKPRVDKIIACCSNW